MGDERLRELERRLRAEGLPLPLEVLKRHGRKLLDIKIPGDPTSLKARGYNIQGEYRLIDGQARMNALGRIHGTEGFVPYFAKLLNAPVRMLSYQELRQSRRLWRCEHRHMTRKAAWRCCRREAYKREVLRVLKNSESKGSSSPTTEG